MLKQNWDDGEGPGNGRQDKVWLRKRLNNQQSDNCGVDSLLHSIVSIFRFLNLSFKWGGQRELPHRDAVRVA